MISSSVDLATALSVKLSSFAKELEMSLASDEETLICYLITLEDTDLDRSI